MTSEVLIINKLTSEVYRIRTQVLSLLVAVAVISIVYLDTFTRLLNGLWGSAQNSHGPIVLLISVVLLVIRLRNTVCNEGIKKNVLYTEILAWLLFLTGLMVFTVGRAQSVYVLEVGALIPILISLNAIFIGWHAVSKAWPGYFFLLFAIPLPGSIVDMVTQPMKLAVSIGAENLLYQLGYPVARTGVMISIGQYQLLVADACAGLSSLFTLEALGLLYMSLVNYPSKLRSIILAILIIPISYAANVIRVLLLSLITYYWGDGAGQGYMHDFSGILLFLTALVLIIFVDGLVRSVLSLGKKNMEVFNTNA